MIFRRQTMRQMIADSRACREACGAAGAGDGRGDCGGVSDVEMTNSRKKGLTRRRRDTEEVFGRFRVVTPWGGFEEEGRSGAVLGCVSHAVGFRPSTSVCSQIIELRKLESGFETILRVFESPCEAPFFSNISDVPFFVRRFPDGHSCPFPAQPVIGLTFRSGGWLAFPNSLVRPLQGQAPRDFHGNAPEGAWGYGK